jgi:Repeat of Unknown Function (DUF347)
MSRSAAPSSDFASKVPEVTLIFWIIKIAATTLGETGGDTVTMTLNWGYLAGTLLFLGILIVLVIVQIAAKNSIRLSIGPRLWPPLHSARPWRILPIVLLGSATRAVRHCFLCV